MQRAWVLLLVIALLGSQQGCVTYNLWKDDSPETCAPEPDPLDPFQAPPQDGPGYVIIDLDEGEGDRIDRRWALTPLALLADALLLPMSLGLLAIFSIANSGPSGGL